MLPLLPRRTALGLVVMALFMAPAAQAQLTNYGRFVDEGQGTYLGSGSMDVTPSVVAANQADINGQADGPQLPIAQSTWMYDLFLASNSWRWSNPVTTPPGLAVTSTSGFYNFNFVGGANVVMGLSQNYPNETGDLDLFLQGLLPQPPPDFAEPFRVEIFETFSGGANGQVTTAGSVVVNGTHFASFTSSHSVLANQNLTSLPMVQTVLAARVTPGNGGLEAAYEGTIVAGESFNASLNLFIDEGQGFQLGGNGSLTLGPSPQPQCVSVDGSMNISVSSWEKYIVLANMSWMNAWIRAQSEPTEWTDGPPLAWAMTQTFNLGTFGIAEVIVIADLTTGGIDLGIDVTQLAQGFTSNLGSYDLRSLDTITPTGSQFFAGTGDVYTQGITLGTITGTYETESGLDFSNEPNVLVDLETTNTVTDLGAQFPRTMIFSGTAHIDPASTLDMNATFNVGGGQSITATGDWNIDPVATVPYSGQGPLPPANQFDVTGQLTLSQPLPSRSLMYAIAPALHAWMQDQASVSLYTSAPGPGFVVDGSLNFGEAGWGSYFYSYDAYANFLDLTTDTEDVDYAELLPLPEQSYFNSDNTSEGEDDGTETDVGCVTFCEIVDGEEICTATCQVRHRSRLVVLPRGPNDGDDTLLDLFGDLFLCMLFSPDGLTVTFTGYYNLTDQAPQVAAPNASSNVFFAPPSPNPSAGDTQFTFRLPTTSPVELKVFDARGRLVRTVARGSMGAGQHQLAWDGQDERGQTVASGVYWARLSVRESTTSRKVVILR